MLMNAKIAIIRISVVEIAQRYPKIVSAQPAEAIRIVRFRKTVFRTENGTVTAGNASPLSDGASAAWIGSGNAAGILGMEPLARIAGRGAHANDPQYFGYAPVEAANKALAKAGIGWDQVGAVELNEAFAAQSLACINAWGIDPGIVNRHGGAIAMGHPLGASGGRILGTLARSLQASGERWGVAAICIGVGQGLAVVLENVTASAAVKG
jgi:acetyl-CoA acyltransferase